MALLMCGGAAAAQPRSASAPQLLLTTPTGLMAPVWSPDGSKIAVTGDNYTGIMVANADGTGLRSLGLGSNPSWLPDNESIVYTVVKDNGQVYTSSTMLAMNVVSGESVTLTSRTDMIPLTPAVSPDGTKVAFQNAADQSIYVVTLKY